MNKFGKAALKALFYPLFFRYVRMPGKSFKGQPRNLTSEESSLRAALTGRIEALSGKIGIRHHLHGSSLGTAAAYIKASFEELGYTPSLQEFEFKGTPMHNIVVVIPGGKLASQWVVIGAHYDTVPTTPGADDNASGVAALLELAARLKDSNPDRTICLCAYANEEHNGGKWENMGSYAHARSLKEKGTDVVGMISLEMLGYYSDAEGSQKYPFPLSLFYPSQGNFIAFVGNTKSGRFVRTCIEHFRSVASVESEGGAIPERFADIARSDHWAFWQHGYPGFMLTDTSNFRTPYVHTPQDTIDTLNLDKMTRVVAGIESVIRKLAN